MTSRRDLLKWSGVSLLSPFMQSVFAQPATPRRVVIFVEGNSFYPSTVMSTATRAALGRGPAVKGEDFFRSGASGPAQVLMGSTLSTASALTPLAMSGLEQKAAVVLGLSSVITGGGHSSGRGALSCSRGGVTASIDAVLGTRLKGTAPFEVVRVGANSDPGRLSYAVCTFGLRRPAPVMMEPGDVYQRLFGALAQGTSNPAVAKNARMLDFARDDVRAALATFPGSSTERAKLEAYLGALESLQARTTTLLSMQSQVAPYLPMAPPTGQEFFAKLTSQVDLVTGALLGGLTNVAVIVSGADGGLTNLYRSVFEEIAASGEVSSWTPEELAMNRHTLQHGVGVDKNRIAINAVTRKHVELIARLARALDAVPEAGGTVLDHTAILFISDNGEAHHSAAEEWPALLVGGRALGLRTDGRTVIYPRLARPGHRQVSNLFNTLGHAAGDTSLNAFGAEGPQRVAEGPLSELVA